MSKVKYCALTTISSSLKSFVMPAMYELEKNGYSITVGCANDPEFAEDLPESIQYLPLDIERGFNFKKTIGTIGMLYSYFHKEKPDMVEYGTENIAFCAAIAGRLAGVPVRIYNHWGARYVGFTGASRMASIFIEKTAALFSTDIRQVSHLNAEMCVNDRIYPRRKVKVLGDGGTIGVDFHRFDIRKKEENREAVRRKYHVPQDAFVYGFLGRIQTDKGINELLTAFKPICEENQNTYLMLIGSTDNTNPIQAELLDYAQNCTRIVFAGFASEPEKMMCACDVLVHPTYREGFGMVLQEAAALKLPIITTDIKGPGEFIKHDITGILVTVKDSGSLEKAMRSMLGDQKLRQRYADNCYDYTRGNFERSVMVGRIVEDRKQLTCKQQNRK